jgi:WH1 domain
MRVVVKGSVMSSEIPVMSGDAVLDVSGENETKARRCTHGLISTTAMPSSSTISANEKSLVRSVIPSPTKILAASLARIYFAYPDPNSWSYGGLQGALVLAADRSRGAHFFCLVDLVGSRGVLWEHELYKDFEYNEDRAFFHTFAGDVRATSPYSAPINV